jgi:hypothetical protein
MRGHLPADYHLAYQLLGGSCTIIWSTPSVKVFRLIIIREHGFKLFWVQWLCCLIGIGVISQPIGGELVVDVGQF